MELRGQQRAIVQSELKLGRHRIIFAPAEHEVSQERAARPLGNEEKQRAS